MNKLINSVKSAAVNFVRDEEGAQIVEYALIIAVVSIALVVALSALTTNGGGFSAFVLRVKNCLTTATCS